VEIILLFQNQTYIPSKKHGWYLSKRHENRRKFRS